MVIVTNDVNYHWL